MVCDCCCFIGNSSGFMQFSDIIFRNSCNSLHISWSRTLRLKSPATWSSLFEFFIRGNISFQNFSNGSIWPLGCLYKTLKIVFFLFSNRISTETDSTSSEFMLKSFRILISTDWWIYSETPPPFFAFSPDEYLYRLVIHIMIY